LSAERVALERRDKDENTPVHDGKKRKKEREVLARHSGNALIHLRDTFAATSLTTLRILFCPCAFVVLHFFIKLLLIATAPFTVIHFRVHCKTAFSENGRIDSRHAFLPHEQKKKNEKKKDLWHC